MQPTDPLSSLDIAAAEGVGPTGHGASLDALLRASVAIASGADPAAATAHFTPWLAAQVAADADAGRFALWGESTVIDEHSGTAVVGRPLFDLLHELAGVRAVWPVGNAGLLHVYGYLFSEEKTPFGYKRERWMGGGVAAALDLPSEHFSPWTVHGTETLLQRVTDAALPRLGAEPGHAGPAASVDEWDAAVLARTRVVVAADGSAALVYGVRWPDSGAPMRLVTIFPVEAASAEWLRALGSGPPRLRYNVAVAGREPGAALRHTRFAVR
ncbi:hypothetical protein EV379_2103 [Microterricola gilva]|uniref:Amino acid deaminase n=1 Tax=Microterricola gilva TaxID=393267 RepID=A0A4Q8AP32_9MICO|nr:amino acid deaminase [Microterricola gilva]RZU65765.1 hypothetical protein EV379_2103 [Microterricola gilva]